MNGIQEVRGSTPLISTKQKKHTVGVLLLFVLLLSRGASGKHKIILSNDIDKLLNLL